MLLVTLLQGPPGPCNSYHHPVRNSYRARSNRGSSAVAFTKVATVQEVPPGKSKQVKVGNKTLALFNVNGAFHAIDDTCPHRGAPLWEGTLVGNEVTCPWHAAQFDVT